MPSADTSAALLVAAPFPQPASMLTDIAATRAALSNLDVFFFIFLSFFPSFIFNLVINKEVLLSLYPFTEPTMIPESKYFWKNGYITTSGRLETMIVAYLRSSASCAL